MPADAVSSSARAAPRQEARFDVVLLAAVLALVALGVVMVYSASAVRAASRLGDGAYYLKRQGVAAVVGLLLCAAVLRIGYKRLEPFIPVFLGGVAVLLVLTLSPLGVSGGGAQRWVRLGGFQLQPTELVKIVLCLWLAHFIARKEDAITRFRSGFLPPLLVFGAFGGLLLQQPDFGTTAVLVGVMLVVLFVAGTPMSFVVAAGVAAAPAAYHLITSSDYRMRRITAFLDPFADRFDAGYQVAEALMAMGSGGLFGLGLGDGRLKLGFLPAGHTDYILATIGEELGLAGVALTLVLFGVVVWRGIRAALRAADPFGAHLAFGLTALLAIEVVVNTGMCLALLPSKGLALPFLSYGGSSMVSSLVTAGLILSVSSDSGGYFRAPAGATRCR